jgi:hypothetical protein
LAGYFDSVCSRGNSDGLVVVEVLEFLDAEVCVRGVFEVGHFFPFVDSYRALVAMVGLLLLIQVVRCDLWDIGFE